ncbi:MAG: NAD(P)-binding protein [Actinobacteria bacterium]|nr:NAD(P)-binding protein [Actinomycetota bacterium]
MQPVVVVGAGIAGIACARALADAGLPVRVLDRAGVPGGRMATAEHAGRPVDVGASYFTVSDPRFEAVVAGWQQRGLARPWTDTFDVAAPDGIRTSTGPLRWAAGAGLQSLVADLAELAAGLTVERCEVAQVSAGPTVDGEPAAAVVLAMPDPQARAVLHPGLTSEREELTARFQPVLVLAAGWPERDWAMEHGMFVNGDPRLSWIADDGSRRGDGAPVLVAHSTPAWAADWLDRPEQAEPELVRALREVLEIGSAPSWTGLHRWAVAKPAAGRPAAFRLWPSRIGACGDGWGEKPRVEAAFLSGLRLGTALAARLPADR